ncbi:hypothetical protein PSYJA_08253 [Pseudomonas syringae pv. japonica str. M301072]|uniref:Uncharacterized protein n=1 Tax=Pseudomonas syringae pv. japonica str. M301072 TaxID=629262 RepID=F3FFH2_PSESX|nr:hypothetical protein PSYJA_08253 [Pseudomonas syringae pv. japonica str. M301072]
MHGLLVVFGDKELKPLTKQHQVGVLIGGLRGMTNIGVNILDIWGSKDYVPVPVAMACPGIEKVHRPISSLGSIHTTGEIKAIENFVCPLLREKSLSLIKYHKGVSRHPMEPSSNTFHAFLGLVIDI